MKIRQYALSLLCRRMTVLAEWEENPLWRRLYIDFPAPIRGGNA